eukprot:scaffold3999_cov101-Isochrysis_galbana.AAC.4
MSHGAARRSLPQPTKAAALPPHLHNRGHPAPHIRIGHGHPCNPPTAAAQRSGVFRPRHAAHLPPLARLTPRSRCRPPRSLRRAPRQPT